MKGVVEPCGSAASARPSSARVTNASAAWRAARADSSSSASRRRFSISASLSMLGQAHNSPIVSGATRW